MRLIQKMRGASILYINDRGANSSSLFPIDFGFPTMVVICDLLMDIGYEYTNFYE